MTEDPDWIFRPILHTHTRTDYDASKVMEAVEEMNFEEVEE